MLVPVPIPVSMREAASDARQGVGSGWSAIRGCISVDLR
jgi:hypothetical protein